MLINIDGFSPLLSSVDDLSGASTITEENISMKAVVVDSRITDLFTYFDIEKEIFAAENIELAIENVITPEEYVERCKDADVLLLIGTKTPRKSSPNCPNAK